MSKIGRNDPCPCGSGKKYKQCHLKMETETGNANTKTANDKLDFEQLLKQYNSVQIIGLLAALQLHPVNHGRNFRFEQMVRGTLLQFDPDDKKPLASWEILKAIIEGYEDGMSFEDPLTNAFTETAIFEEGNYIVYSGIYVGFTEILNQLTECIFLHKNNLNKEYVQKVRDTIGILLFMSNSAAIDAQHTPHIYQNSSSGNIELPEHDKAVKYTDAIYFPKDYLVDICKKHRYDYARVNDFILIPGCEELTDEDPENNVVNFKPLIEVGDEIILYMPTGVINAIIEYIYSKAKEYNCYEELLDLLYERQFYLSCAALTKTGWRATDIGLPPYNGGLFIRETVFQFDNQKLAYVCYINSGKTPAIDRKKDDTYEQRTNAVAEYLGNINSEQPINVFCLYIIAEVAQDVYFMWSKPSAGNQSLALTYRELWTIAHSEKVDSLSLWKFAKCYSRTNELTRVMAMGGMMDAYAIYRKNHGSLLDSDKENPLGGMVMIVNGSSDDFRREVQKKENEHAVLIFHNRQVAYAKVTRYKDYAPIYIEREMSKDFRIVIENYKMPIWIANNQTKANEDSWANSACEAVAFWLNKMQPFLAQYLNVLGLIQFEIEIAIDDNLLKAEQYIIKDIRLEEIQISSKVIAPTVQLSIPFDFLYAVILPDNTADKILMKAVLNGLLLYIKESGNDTQLNEDIIDDIVGETLQPSQAKMLLFSDASSNIKMDSRHLPSLRYIKDTDVSYVLDNLVSYLPKGYVIPEIIPDLPSKIKLCDDIVTALIVQIKSRLVLFDGPDLLRWLIRRNEKCIQVREFREILIPAKIACFSDADREVKELMDNEKNLVTTGHAIRTLIEFTASKIPSGNKWPNLDDIDELLALTNQLTEWGALSEAMRLKLDDPEMGLLPSGRIGTEKTLEKAAFKPYAAAKTESEVFRNMEDFESNYAPVTKKENVGQTDESKVLDIAFKAEFNITVTALSIIIGFLVNEGFAKAEPCVVIEKEHLVEALNKIEGLTADDIDASLNLLTLLERGELGKPPEGYTSVDIFPWRYNRQISYMRRPMVKISEVGKINYYYGYRHLLQFIDHLFYLLYSSKLPDPKSTEMKSWLAAVSGDKGNPFRQKVREWFENETDFQVIPYEVKMDKTVTTSHIQTDKHYGDIDLLVIDHNNQIVYSIECKNITGGRNIHEMKVEIDDYLGRDGKNKKAKIKKHVERDKWLNENKSALSNLIPEIEEYTIRSLILTADEIPLAYLKKTSLPLPLKSFVFLRKKGISYLSEP